MNNVFELKPNVECENTTLLVGLFNLNMALLCEDDRYLETKEIYGDFMKSFNVFKTLYPWSCPSEEIKIELFEESKYWYGIQLKAPIGWCFEDVDLVKLFLFNFSQSNKNLFYTIKINSSDNLLPDFDENDNYKSEKEYERLNWNRLWCNGGYIYRIPLKFMEHQILNLSSSLNYMLNRNKVKLKRFKNPYFVSRDSDNDLKTILKSFVKLEVKVSRNIASLIDLNPWLPRAALINDYFIQEMKISTADNAPVYPGSSLRFFQVLSDDYRMSLSDKNDNVVVEIMLNNLAASLLTFPPFNFNCDSLVRGVLLTNVIELYLQHNNNLPIGKQIQVKFPTSTNLSITSSEIENWDLLLKTLNFEIKPNDVNFIERSSNFDNFDFTDDETNFYEEDDVNLEIFSKPVNGRDLLQEHYKHETKKSGLEDLNDFNIDPMEFLSKLANSEGEEDEEDEGDEGDEGEDAEIQSEFNNTITEDDFFEYFLKNALKLQHEDIEKLRGGLGNMEL